MDADPATMEKHEFTAIGYSFEWLMPEYHEQYLPKIAGSLRRGLPVISYVIIGPPEAGLITGYDEGGDVIMGWNFFQNFELGIEKDTEGYYRKRDWAKDVQSLLIIGDKIERPSLKGTYQAALELGLIVTRTPIVRPELDAPEWYQRRHNGLATYTAWAEHLQKDEDFLMADERMLQQCYRVHNDAVGWIAEARWYGSQFLIGMTENGDDLIHRDAIEDLYHATALYAGEHGLIWGLVDLADGIKNPDAWKKFAEPAVRQKMVPIILEARKKDSGAADHIERVLSFI